MGRTEIGRHEIFLGTGGDNAPVTYVIDAPEHPFDRAAFARRRDMTVVTIPVSRWHDALTPWPAARLYREEPDFGGDADSTLNQLVEVTMPRIEQDLGLSPVRRAICGYSLGGLFALYALVACPSLDACACISGSVWYEGWTAFLGGLDIDLSGRFAYLSLGTKEKRGALPIMRGAQDRMEECAHILVTHGCSVTFRTGPGNHFQHVTERISAGLDALDEALSKQ